MAAGQDTRSSAQEPSAEEPVDGKVTTEYLRAMRHQPLWLAR